MTPPLQYAPTHVIPRLHHALASSKHEPTTPVESKVDMQEKRTTRQYDVVTKTHLVLEGTEGGGGLSGLGGCEGGGAGEEGGKDGGLHGWIWFDTTRKSDGGGGRNERGT